MSQNIIFPKTIALPSGKTATILRKMRAGDTIRGRRMVGADADNQTALGLAALSQIVQIDGKPVVYEDMLEMELDDIEVISDALDLGKKNSASPTPPDSPPSSSSGSSLPN